MSNGKLYHKSDKITHQALWGGEQSLLSFEKTDNRVDNSEMVPKGHSGQAK